MLGLDGVQGHAFVVVDIYDSYSYDLQSAPVLTRTAGPEIACPWGLLPRLGYVGRVYSYGFSAAVEMFPDRALVEREPVECFVFKMLRYVFQRTFRDAPSEGSLCGGDGHEQFHCIYEDLFKRFAYICH